MFYYKGCCRSQVVARCGSSFEVPHITPGRFFIKWIITSYEAKNFVFLKKNVVVVKVWSNKIFIQGNERRP